MTFTPKEVILGATLPLENGSTVTFSIAGHVEAERDFDDAVVIFGRKLLKYTNSASDADRLTVRQVVASITSTPLDKVPDVGTPTSVPVPKKEVWEPKITRSSYDAMQTAKQDTVPATPPSAAEQAKAAVERVIKPRDAGAAPEPTPTAPPVTEAPAPAAPPAPATAPPAAPVQKPVDGFGLCERCGEAVPESQAKLSRLFQNKTLCKKCMEAP